MIYSLGVVSFERVRLPRILFDLIFTEFPYLFLHHKCTPAPRPVPSNSITGTDYDLTQPLNVEIWEQDSQGKLYNSISLESCNKFQLWVGKLIAGIYFSKGKQKWRTLKQN